MIGTHRTARLFAAALLLVFVTVAASYADITVSITGVTPADGKIGAGDEAIVYWKIEAGTSSGTYDVVVGGDGTPGTGDGVAATNGTGSFTGTTTGQTNVSADTDLVEDGQYTIYVIAVDSTDETIYGAASTTVTLDTPPDMVTGVSAGIGEGRLFLAWDTHPDADIVKYLVYYGTHSGTEKADYDGVDSDLGTSPVDAGTATELILSGLTDNVVYYIRISAVDSAGSESELSAEVSGTPTNSQGAAESAGDTDGCFIATAAFGSYDNERVLSLRRFRDGVLAHTELGRQFIKAYYRISPPIARDVAARPMLRAAVRTALYPAALYSDIALSRIGSLAAGFASVAVGAFLLISLRRKDR
jgi:hypothetical protein